MAPILAATIPLCIPVLLSLLVDNELSIAVSLGGGGPRVPQQTINSSKSGGGGVPRVPFA